MAILSGDAQASPRETEPGLQTVWRILFRCLAIFSRFFCSTGHLLQRWQPAIGAEGCFYGAPGVSRVEHFENKVSKILARTPAPVPKGGEIDLGDTPNGLGGGLFITS